MVILFFVVKTQARKPINEQAVEVVILFFVVKTQARKPINASVFLYTLDYLSDKCVVVSV